MRGQEWSAATSPFWLTEQRLPKRITCTVPVQPRKSATPVLFVNV
jgi:hypothetical protein